jgi:hypothetical protein
MSNWWAFLSWYENVIVWPLAIGALVLLLKAKSVRQRVIFGCLLVLVFLPHIQKAAGDVYFDYLCRTQAGEFIYRTVDNVEGILQMRPRDGSKDYFDRMRAGIFRRILGGIQTLKHAAPGGLSETSVSLRQWMPRPLSQAPSKLVRTTVQCLRHRRPLIRWHVSLVTTVTNFGHFERNSLAGPKVNLDLPGVRTGVCLIEP